MGRASSVQVGDSSSTLEIGGHVHCCVQPTLRNISRTCLLPISLCSACSGDTSKLHEQQVLQPDGGRRAPEHSAAPEISKGNPKCRRKWCSWLSFTRWISTQLPISKVKTWIRCLPPQELCVIHTEAWSPGSSWMPVPTLVHVHILPHPVFPGKLFICSVTCRQRSDPRPWTAELLWGLLCSWEGLEAGVVVQAKGMCWEGTFFSILGGPALPGAAVFRDRLWKPLEKRAAGLEALRKTIWCRIAASRPPAGFWPYREAKGLGESLQMPPQHIS